MQTKSEIISEENQGDDTSATTNNANKHVHKVW